MADEIDMLEDAEFENEMKAMGEDQLALIQYNTRQTFKISKVVVSHESRIKAVEKRDRKVMGFVGGASAIFATAIAATLDYFLRRPS